MTIAYTFSVLNTSVSVASSYTWVGGNRRSKISDVEKHHPRASQTLVFMKEIQISLSLLDAIVHALVWNFNQHMNE